MYTIEQYQRLLKCATRMSLAINDMRLCPLDLDILKELYDAREEYSNTQTDVVNEDYCLERGEK